MTLLLRRSLLASLPLLALTSLPRYAFAQDKPTDKAGTCTSKLTFYV